MKKAFLLTTILFITLLSSAQEKVKWLDIDGIWKQAALYESENDYENALQEVKKIPKNDSSYYSSLTSRAYYLINTEQYEEAIKTTDEGLRSKYQPYHFYFMINKIAGYLGLEEFEKAIEVLDEALEVYPRNYKFYYSKGLAYEGLNRYQDAAEMYQKSISFNPFYANSHLKLAILCYNEELITQAMMCLNMYLLINPDGENSFKILDAYNQMVKTKNENKKHPGVTLSKDDKSFEEIDLIINNYAALNKKYKISNKILLPVIKQNHVMISQLEDYEGNGGFWDKYYVPFYKFIDENDLFDAFTYTIAYSVENKSYKAIVNKNISLIKSFIPKYQDAWINIIGINEEIIDGKKTEVKYFYNDSRIEGFGEFKDGKTIGKWEIFRKNGDLASVGYFDEEGKKHGKWLWYNDKGTVSEQGEYEHGSLINEYLVYHLNGRLKIQANYKDGKLNGSYKKYNEHGALMESFVYKDGEYDGEYLSFHPLGEEFIEYKIPYEEGKINGTVYQYYPDGKIKAEVSFKDNKKEGETVIYYHNGKVDTKKEFANNLLTNDYIEFHSNGNLYQKGKCEEGDFMGEWKSYYADNTINTESTFNKGKLDGVYKKYDRDGKLHYEYIYRRGEIIAYTFYNKEQQVIKEAKKQKGSFFYEGHAPNGNVTSEGDYDISGGKEGEWKFYSDNHVLESMEFLEENLLQGDVTTYHENGTIRSISPYVNDTLEGYYSSFYSNKQLYQQGWYHKGKLQGEWLTYYLDGSLQKRSYYTNGKLYGLSEHYAVDGSLQSSYFYYENELKTEFYYNPKGELIEEINIDVDSINYFLINRFVNGKISSFFTMKYDRRHGPYYRNYFSGKKYAEGKYFNGEKSGEWKWYHENGKVSSIGNYIDGEKDGVWKSYHENGKLNTENTYDYGDEIKTEKTYNENGILTQTREFDYDLIHGEINFYSEEGKLQLIRYYQHGSLIGYSYLNKSGQKVPMIPIVNETAKILAYFDNGKPSREMEVRNGSFINVYKEYYYTGKLFEELFYVDDERNGICKVYYPDGKVMEEKPYTLGQLNGEVKIYHPNGKIKEQTTFLNGEKHGDSKFYSSSGKLIKELVYFGDEVFSEKIYK